MEYLVFLEKMKNKKIFFLIIFLVTGIFFVLLLGLKKENNFTSQSELKKINSTILLKSLYSDKEIFLEDLLLYDELNLINIWASWCLPCKAEHSYLVRLNQNYDINLIGINYKDNLKNSKKFLYDLGNPYDSVLIDTDGTKSIELGAIGVPETYLIDKENKIIKKFVGPLDLEDYENIINLIQK